MKPILDVCCGSKMFYFDKDNPLVHFNDIRNLKDTWQGIRKASERLEFIFKAGV